MGGIIRGIDGPVAHNSNVGGGVTVRTIGVNGGIL